MAKHESVSGKCAMCEQIFNKYPGFNPDLKKWFQDTQAFCPEFHIACAGRGKIDQNQFFSDGTSNAKWGQSAHNFNCAIDTWVMDKDGHYTLPEDFYMHNILPHLPDWIEWYGHPEYKHNKSKYYELPHFEVKTWKQLLAQNEAKLVEQA